MKKLICFVVAVVLTLLLISGCYFRAEFDPIVEWDTTPRTIPDDEAAVIQE